MNDFNNSFLKNGNFDQCFINDVKYLEINNIFYSYHQEFDKKGIKFDERVIIFSDLSKDFMLLYLSLLSFGCVVSVINSEIKKNEFLKIKKIFKPDYILDLEDFKNIEILKNLKYKLPVFNFNKESIVVFTSGSTGTPKGVVHSLNSCLESVKKFDRYFNLNKQNNYLLSVPVYSIAGIAIIFRCLFSGLELIIPKSVKNEFLEKEIRTKKINCISLVPNQLSYLLNKNIDINLFKIILIGGAAIGNDLKEKLLLRQNHNNLFFSYGSSEFFATIAVSTNIENTFTAGDFLDGIGFKIKDKVLYLKSSSQFIKYLGRKKETDFFNTNDLALIDNNKLTILGRSSLLINSYGLKISPFEIEEVVNDYKGVSESVVVKRVDNDLNEYPHLFIVKNIEFDLNDFNIYLKDNLQKEKIPKSVSFLKKIPKLSIGKIDYQRLSL